mgnify:CR=1 FL=1
MFKTKFSFLFFFTTEINASSAAGRTSSGVSNTVLNGRGAPSPKVGANGDFYIDVMQMTFYGPKKNGLWPAGISLKGSDGKNGNDGKNGSDGSTSKAVTGPAGPKGETGAAGPADMGKVMGAIKAKIAGKADGATVSSLVKAALNK